MMRMERIAPETRTVCQFTGAIAAPSGQILNAREVAVCDEAELGETR